MNSQQAIELALAHHQAGRLREAESLYRRMLSDEPTHPDALHLLGMLAFECNQHQHAAELIRRAIASRPAAEFRANLSIVLGAMGQYEDAISEALAAIALKPGLPEAHYGLAYALHKSGRQKQAIEEYRVAINLRPDYPVALNNLGSALLDQERHVEAAEAFRVALQRSPGDSVVLQNLMTSANRLNTLRQLAEAATAYREIVNADPRHVAARNNLAHVLMLQGTLDDALAECTTALNLDPNAAEVHNNLGNIHRDRGDLDLAIPAYRTAAQLRPDFFYGNLLYMMHFHPAYGPEELLREHQIWNAAHAESLKLALPPANDRSPGRRLRIGYVGPDFREHSQAHFIIPLLSQHDHERFEIFCYADVPQPDSITNRIRGYADTWRSTVGLDDATLAKMIRTDQIDVLIDLTLHMAFGRLLAFARRPAPVQLTWLGYPGTTGLTTMDYRLTDRHMDPPESDAFYTEKSIRLPDSFWCYDPLENTPSEITPLPAMQNGYVTFGSLNTFAKMNDQVLDLWAATMRAVPTSRLLLLCDSGGQRERLLHRLESGGVERGRIEFVHRQPRPKYMQAFGRIDIALDTFPANGHTTTLDGLWMGVPVVTLPGRTAISRGAMSILNTLGIPELVADSPGHFVTIATDLSNNLPRLAALRTSLRDRLQSSPLMDAPRFARNIESIYRRIWLDWVAH